MNRRWLIAGIIIAIAVKAGLFAFIALTNPDSIIEADTHQYLPCAAVLADAFQGRDISHYNIFRTPGYPFFLMVFHHWLHVPLIGIIVIQLVLNILAAWVTAMAAARIDSRLVPLSALIILLDFPTTVFSLMLMTEALFIFLMSILLYSAVRYLQEDRWRWLWVVLISSTAAVFVRPAAYFLPLLIGGLMVIRAFCHTRSGGKTLLSRIPDIGIRPGSWKRAGQAAVFLLLAYAAVFAWQYRNYLAIGHFKFSNIDQATIQEHGFIGRYARGDISNKIDAESFHPVVYYVYTAFRHVVDLMTEPGSLKYFGSDTLKKIGKVFGYLTVILWIPGFLAGLFYMKSDHRFWFAAMVVFYFMTVTIVAVGWETTPRFRVPMMPFIAVLSAYGWGLIMQFLKDRRRSSS